MVRVHGRSRDRESGSDYGLVQSGIGRIEHSGCASGGYLHVVRSAPSDDLVTGDRGCGASVVGLVRYREGYGHGLRDDGELRGGRGGHPVVGVGECGGGGGVGTCVELLSRDGDGARIACAQADGLGDGLLLASVVDELSARPRDRRELPLLDDHRDASCHGHLGVLGVVVVQVRTRVLPVLGSRGSGGVVVAVVQLREGEVHGGSGSVDRGHMVGRIVDAAVGNHIEPDSVERHVVTVLGDVQDYFIIIVSDASGGGGGPSHEPRSIERVSVGGERSGRVVYHVQRGGGTGSGGIVRHECYIELLGGEHAVEGGVLVDIGQRREVGGGRHGELVGVPPVRPDLVTLLDLGIVEVERFDMISLEIGDLDLLLLLAPYDVVLSPGSGVDVVDHVEGGQDAVDGDVGGLDDVHPQGVPVAVLDDGPSGLGRSDDDAAVVLVLLVDQDVKVYRPVFHHVAGDEVARVGVTVDVDMLVIAGEGHLELHDVPACNEPEVLFRHQEVLGIGTVGVRPFGERHVRQELGLLVSGKRGDVRTVGDQQERQLLGIVGELHASVCDGKDQLGFDYVQHSGDLGDLAGGDVVDGHHVVVLLHLYAVLGPSVVAVSLERDLRQCDVLVVVHLRLDDGVGTALDEAPSRGQIRLEDGTVADDDGLVLDVRTGIAELDALVRRGLDVRVHGGVGDQRESGVLVRCGIECRCLPAQIGGGDGDGRILLGIGFRTLVRIESVGTHAVDDPPESDRVPVVDDGGDDHISRYGRCGGHFSTIAEVPASEQIIRIDGTYDVSPAVVDGGQRSEHAAVGPLDAGHDGIADLEDEAVGLAVKRDGPDYDLEGSGEHHSGDRVAGERERCLRTHSCIDVVVMHVQRVSRGDFVSLGDAERHGTSGQDELRQVAQFHAVEVLDGDGFHISGCGLVEYGDLSDEVLPSVGPVDGDVEVSYRDGDRIHSEPFVRAVLVERLPSGLVLVGASLEDQPDVDLVAVAGFRNTSVEVQVDGDGGQRPQLDIYGAASDDLQLGGCDVVPSDEVALSAQSPSCEFVSLAADEVQVDEGTVGCGELGGVLLPVVAGGDLPAQPSDGLDDGYRVFYLSPHGVQVEPEDVVAVYGIHGEVLADGGVGLGEVEVRTDVEHERVLTVLAELPSGDAVSGTGGVVAVEGVDAVSRGQQVIRGRHDAHCGVPVAVHHYPYRIPGELGHQIVGVTLVDLVPYDIARRLADGVVVDTQGEIVLDLPADEHEVSAGDDYRPHHR